MYFARKNTAGATHYILRQSFQEGGIFKSRDLLDLGSHPASHIVYTGDVHYEIDPALLTHLQTLGVKFNERELEELFFPFLDEYIRYKLEPFINRHKYRHWRPMSAALRKEALATTHIMDRRRVHFLRFGHCSPDLLDKSPPLFKVLLHKSRDEIEQLIMQREMDLRPGEYKRYLFTIFDLQRFFPEKLTRSIPSALDQQQVDEYFLQEYCRLDQDTDFWAGYETEGASSPYLLRYLFMFFDLAEEGDLLWNTLGGRHRRQRFRGHRPQPVAQRMNLSEAAAAFGLSREQFAALSKKELTALYRKKAHILHPDKGGDHDQFVKLTAAYNELLKSRP